MFAMMAITVLSACAQKLDVSKVPAAVKASFEKKYPGVAARWEKEDGRYEVDFKQNGTGMSALIEANGTIVETEMDIKETDLPVAALSYVKAHYTGKKITDAARITKADGTVNYEAEVGDIDVLFDSNGNFLKEEKDGEKDEKDEKD